MTKFNCDKIQNTKCPVSENQQRQDWQKRAKQCTVHKTSWGPRFLLRQDLKKVPEPEYGFDKKSKSGADSRFQNLSRVIALHFWRGESNSERWWLGHSWRSDPEDLKQEDLSQVLTQKIYSKKIWVRFWPKKSGPRRSLGNMAGTLLALLTLAASILVTQAQVPWQV